jgi:hypothetical protein
MATIKAANACLSDHHGQHQSLQSGPCRIGINTHCYVFTA